MSHAYDSGQLGLVPYLALTFSLVSANVLLQYVRLAVGVLVQPSE